MTDWQTAYWVWTLCHEKNWEKGDVYAGNFFNHGMTGDLLENLDLKILENELGIDPVHSHELLSVIQELSTTPSWIQRNIGSEPGPFVRGIESMCGSIQLGWQVLPSHTGISSCSYPVTMNSPLRQNSSGRSICTSLTPTHSDMVFESGRNFQNCHKTYSTVAGKSDSPYPIDMDISENSVSSFDPYRKNPNVCLEGNGLKIGATKFHRPRQDLEDSRHGPRGPLVNQNTPSFRKNKIDNFRKLVLAFQSDEMPVGGIDWIRSFFCRIDNDVEVVPMSKEGTYTITFKDTETAREALKVGKQKGLTIARKFRPRPRPLHPLEYIALVDQRISKGKSLPDYVGLLKKGQKVTVDQAKGKRARLIKPKGKIKTWGWVSMFSEEGKQQLAPC